MLKQSYIVVMEVEM